MTKKKKHIWFHLLRRSPIAALPLREGRGAWDCRHSLTIAIIDQVQLVYLNTYAYFWLQN